MAVDIASYPTLQTFIEGIVSKHGISARKLNEWFESATIRQDILRAVDAPKEGLPWYEYRKLFVTEQSALRGKRFWRANATALSNAQREYGVDPATIVAIIGVETQYGRNTGSFRIIDALTTLTLEYERRSDFFRGELEQYLLLVQELNVDPLALRGSYAGAMGVPQFIPSSYREYAIDFDGDGRRDLIGSNADAIGSVANFLLRHGWRKDGAVVEPLQPEKDLTLWFSKLGSIPMLPLRYLLGYGIVPMEYNDKDEPAALITLEEESGPKYHLGHNNFYVITRYNRSQNYAMAVYELSESIRRLYNVEGQ
ncbi:MAG: lytic murein transglycosylase B [Gammaproteobacteria bacterium]|nr:lytic murein transglycosylase B [Gammaproteobacteria bacterium]